MFNRSDYKHLLGTMNQEKEGKPNNNCFSDVESKSKDNFTAAPTSRRSIKVDGHPSI